MTTREFVEAVDRGGPPPETLPALLRALWADRQGDWDLAHRITQKEEGRDAAWVHAYLHRKEGDPGNARYWYHRAGRQEARAALEAEWEEASAHLLQSA